MCIVFSVTEDIAALPSSLWLWNQQLHSLMTLWCFQVRCNKDFTVWSSLVATRKAGEGECQLSPSLPDTISGQGVGGGFPTPLSQWDYILLGTTVSCYWAVEPVFLLRFVLAIPAQLQRAKTSAVVFAIEWCMIALYGMVPYPWAATRKQVISTSFVCMLF